MKKITNILIDQVKDMEGNILGIGISNSKILKQIEENKKIISCDLLDEIEKGNDHSKNKRTKKISLNKLRKQYKKKKINYLIVEEKMVKDVKNFIKDSIYITNTKIICILNEESKMKQKYNRYKTVIQEINCLDGMLLIIDVTRAKNNKIKEFFYSIIDAIIACIDIITYLLLN